MSEIDEALAAFGGQNARLVAERENAVYEAALPEGRAALRLHRPGYQSIDEIRSELDWMHALAARGVAVPDPLGAPVVLSTGRVATAVRWVEGEPLGAAGVPLAGAPEQQCARFRAVGRAVARFHGASDSLDLGAGFTRHAWDIEGFLGAEPLWGKFWENPVLSDDERGLILRAREAARGVLEAFAERSGDYGLIHADVLRENVLVAGEAVTLIDFDDAGWGFRLYDLATLMSQNEDEPNAEDLLAAAVAGYRELRALPDEDVALLPVFVMMRRFASTGWVVPRSRPGEARVRAYAERALRAARAFMARA